MIDEAKTDAAATAESQEERIVPGQVPEKNRKLALTKRQWVAIVALAALVIGFAGAVWVLNQQAASPETPIESSATLQDAAELTAPGANESAAEASGENGASEAGDSSDEGSEDASSAGEDSDAGEPGSSSDASDASTSGASSANTESSASAESSSTKDSTASASKKSSSKSSSSKSSKSSKSSSKSDSSSSKSFSKSSASSAAKQISVSLSIDATNAHSYNSEWPASLGSFTLKVDEGSSVWDALNSTGLKIKGSSTYVSAIETSAGSNRYLGEKSCGNLSGWIYAVNGTTPSASVGNYILKSGDKIEFMYTCDLGRDL